MLKYSLVFVETNPLAKERICVAVVFIDGDEIEVRYSDKKLKAIHLLLNDKEACFLENVVKELDKAISSVDVLNYMIRYSNNLLTFSKIENLCGVEPNVENKEMVYYNYIEKPKEYTKPIPSNYGEGERDFGLGLFDHWQKDLEEFCNV